MFARRVQQMTIMNVSRTILFVVPLSAAVAGPHGWRSCADAYMRAMDRALLGATSSRAESYDELEHAKGCLLSAPRPKDPELRSLLASGVASDFRLAAAVLSVVQRPNPSLIALALDRVNEQTPAVRLATARSVAAIDTADLPGMSRALVGAYSGESASIVIAAALPAIERLPSSEIAQISVALARRDDPELRRFGWLLAAQHLPLGLESLRTELSRNGASDALRALDLELARQSERSNEEKH